MTLVTTKQHIFSGSAFRGDKTKNNSEVSLLPSCHMFWYFHLCAGAGVIAEGYQDNATSTIVETIDGGGYFVEVILYPEVVVADSYMIAASNELYKRANQL